MFKHYRLAVEQKLRCSAILESKAISEVESYLLHVQQGYNFALCNMYGAKEGLLSPPPPPSPAARSSCSVYPWCALIYFNVYILYTDITKIYMFSTNHTVVVPRIVLKYSVISLTHTCQLSRNVLETPGNKGRSPGHPEQPFSRVPNLLISLYFPLLRDANTDNILTSGSLTTLSMVVPGSRAKHR